MKLANIGLYGQGLCQARHAFEEYVPVAQQTDKQGFHQMLLPYYYMSHSRCQLGNETALHFYLLIKSPYVNTVIHCVCGLICLQN